MSVALLAACGGGSTGAVTGPVVSVPVLTAVKVSLTPDTLVVGESATATASGLDQNSAAIGIAAPTWSTTTPSVATVTPNGVVTAISPGRTTLTASINGKQGERSLTIVQAAVSLVSITPEAGRVVKGATLQLMATTLDYIGRVLPGRSIAWTTSDTAKAAVSSTGLVNAFLPGVVTISAASEGVTASTDITVTAMPDSVATITLSPVVGSLIVGSSAQLDATLRDVAGKVLTLTGRTVTWTVSGIPGVNAAFVDGTGMVTAVSPGTVIVEAFCEGRHGAMTIVIKDNVDQSIVVSFAEPVLTALVGDTLKIVVAVKSTNPLAGVVAVVANLRDPVVLTIQKAGALGAANVWVGLVDVTDLPAGLYQVLATATDSRGARGVGATQFQRDTRVGKGGSGEVPKQK